MPPQTETPAARPGGTDPSGPGPNAHAPDQHGRTVGELAANVHTSAGGSAPVHYNFKFQRSIMHPCL